MKGRIFFPGNPWPQGHPLKSLTISGELVPNKGLFLYLTLISDEYNCEETPHQNDLTGSNWTSVAGWLNYHKCWIGPSQTSEFNGFLVSDGSKPFDLSQPELEFVVDPLPITPSDVAIKGAFGCYVQGHDAVADHKIRLIKTGPTWRVDWRGLVAEAYSGKECFEHEFIVEAENVPFVGLSLWGFDPSVAKRMYNLALDEPLSAPELLQPYITAADSFRLERVKGNLFASWT